VGEDIDAPPAWMRIWRPRPASDQAAQALGRAHDRRASDAGMADDGHFGRRSHAAPVTPGALRVEKGVPGTDS